MVISEGIPPNVDCTEFYEKVMEIKEDRENYDRSMFLYHLKGCGFRKVDFSEYVMKKNNVLKWLEKSNLEVRDQVKILYMYLNAPAEIKKAYNMKVLDGDIYIDAKYLNAVCFKP